MDRLKKRALRAVGGSRALTLLTGALIVTSFFAAMHLSKNSALLLASAPLLTPSGAEEGVDVSWHPPSERDVNDLDSALNSEGTYGFVFDSSETPEAGYGSYNYCNMPHVRKTEYVEAGSEYELQYVELVSPRRF